MTDKSDLPTPPRTRGRLLVAATPPAGDLVRAADIPAGECPRRYCWWWRGLGFEWEVTPSEGCTFLTSPKPLGVMYPDIPCCRCDPSSAVDQYEPREPHLLEDGFPVPRWLSPHHRRPGGEISYDLVMEEDMEFVEGSYRIGGCGWCVVVFSKRPTDEPAWKACAWESGVSGIVVSVPNRMRLNAACVERLMSGILGVGDWRRVRGPDSMRLR